MNGDGTLGGKFGDEMDPDTPLTSDEIAEIIADGPTMTEYRLLATIGMLKGGKQVSPEDLDILEELASRFHSIAHESGAMDPRVDECEYNPAAIALCGTPRCQRLLALFARLRGETA